MSPAQLRGVPARVGTISFDVRGWQMTVDDADPPKATAFSDLQLNYSIPGQGLERALSGTVRSGETKGL
jgi:hypothetical protein